METIVITGMGAVTPLGIGVEAYWRNAAAGRSGISKITSFDASELAVQVAGEIKNLNPSDYMPKDLVRHSDSFMQYAFIAAKEAIEDSKIKINPKRTGIVMGTALNGITTIAHTQQSLSEASHKKVGPRFIPKILGNVAAANIAIAYGIQGPSVTVNTACASGGDAVSAASLMLNAGKADAILAVGAESVLCPIVIYSLSNAQMLSRNANPDMTPRPFDRNRDGFVIGEGGGALMLETLSSATRRGAKIYGVVAGCANTNDAYHVTAPERNGRGAAECMSLAIEEAGITPGDIDYINAHGTGTIQGDIAETIAIKTVFGDNVPAISSTKAATGHMMGAGGITELITCVKAIETGIIPPTINLTDPDPQCDLDFTPLKAAKREVNTAMSNAFGFGGQNSSVIIKRYDG
ncbi:MAG: beta-ketoacyl-[acyl-carrier-protein] synthase family protein [Firmicutes bacterium]|nr:beta-ketoacyl-[acyl-carrier-protein] synthase family protein [Bacillota bacterium]